MRTIFFILIFGIFQATGNISIAQQTNSDTTTYKIDINKSKIKWSCDLHNGFILFNDGVLKLINNKIVDGNFTILMDSIIDLDIDYKLMKITLENTLRSSDFFNTKEYPFSNFTIDYVISTENNETMFGDLSFLGVTKCINFPVKYYLKNDSIIANSEEIIIDRTDWGNTSMSKEDAKSDKSFIVPNEIKIKVILHGFKLQ
jgi:polyisoprenoid-binding protein YceI